MSTSQPNHEYIYGDFDYRKAVNYDGTDYYNPPITITIDTVKYVLPFGTSDNKSIEFKNGYCYIIGENKGLNYISYVEIDLANDIVCTHYVDSNDIDNIDSCFYRIFEKSTEEQIRTFFLVLH
jgi:hypothetical protein